MIGHALCGQSHRGSDREFLRRKSLIELHRSEKIPARYEWHIIMLTILLCCYELPVARAMNPPRLFFHETFASSSYRIFWSTTAIALPNF